MSNEVTNSDLLHKISEKAYSKTISIINPNYRSQASLIPEKSTY